MGGTSAAWALLPSALRSTPGKILGRLNDAEALEAQTSTRTQMRLTELFLKAQKKNWDLLPIGELMASIGKEFVGTPYVGGTLEVAGDERPVVNLEGLDCVTFFENCLAIARCVKQHRYELRSMLEQISITRYREARVSGYCSRLHYTAEWISDNVSKHIVRDISPELHPDKFALHVDFMSTHPQYYKALKDKPELIQRIHDIEQSINKLTHWYVPKERVSEIESKLQSGDIIAIATSKAGLDYAHTGMIVKSDDGAAHFLHASLAKKQVTFDTTISEYLKTVSTHIGISVARPIEPTEH